MLARGNDPDTLSFLCRGLRAAMQSRSKVDKKMSWRRWISNTTGRPYWHNAATGEMRWDAPDGVMEKLSGEGDASDDLLGVSGYAVSVERGGVNGRVHGGMRTARARLEGSDHSDLAPGFKSIAPARGTDDVAGEQERGSDAISGGAVRASIVTFEEHVVLPNTARGKMEGASSMHDKPIPVLSPKVVATGYDSLSVSRAKSSYLRSSFNGLFDKVVKPPLTRICHPCLRCEMRVCHDACCRRRDRSTTSRTMLHARCSHSSPAVPQSHRAPFSSGKGGLNILVVNQLEDRNSSDGGQKLCGQSNAGLANTWSHSELRNWVDDLQESLAKDWQSERDQRKQQAMIRSHSYQEEVDSAEVKLIGVLGEAVMASADPVRKVAELCNAAAAASDANVRFSSPPQKYFIYREVSF